MRPPDNSERLVVAGVRAIELNPCSQQSATELYSNLSGRGTTCSAHTRAESAQHSVAVGVARAGTRSTLHRRSALGRGVPTLVAKCRVTLYLDNQLLSKFSGGGRSAHGHAQYAP